MADYLNIAGRVRTTANDGVAIEAQEIRDLQKDKTQETINQETDAALDDRYTKKETYNKTELNQMITTPNVQYVSVAEFASLPATGSADTIYRVANYDGSTRQVDASVYSEYAWNGSQYIFLCVKSQIGEVFDISVYNNNAKYADLAAALNGGANIPQSLQKGGMSIKFIQSSDNTYVQYRYMGTETTGSPNPFLNVANWQGVDDEPTANSDNLVKSGGVAGMQFIFNVNLYNNVPNTPYTTDGSNTAKEVARLAVPSQFRRFGLVITYLLEDGWVIERNNYDGTGNITNDSIWSRDTTSSTKSWLSILDENQGVFNANVFLYGAYDFSHTLTLTEAINAAVSSGPQRNTRTIIYTSADGPCIAIFNSTLPSASFTDEKSWRVFGYDSAKAELGYFRYSGTATGGSSLTLITGKSEFSEKNIRVITNAGN